VKTEGAIVAQLFLSYSLRDHVLVKMLEDCLLEFGHQIKITVDKPPAGRWREILADALCTSDAIISILTERGLQSNYVVSEIGSARILAQSKHTLLLPVIASQNYHVPSFISDYHCFCLKLREDDLPEAVAIKLLAQQLNLAIAEHSLQRSPRVFISHRHKDEDVVRALVSVLESYYEISSGDMRCTSVYPYKLSPGDKTSDRLRSEIKAAEVVLGIISPESQDSKYVLAELGAAWGCGVPTFPLLIRGATYADVPSPLDERSCLDLGSGASCIQCIQAIGRVTSLKRRENPEDMVKAGEATLELARLARDNPRDNQ
jgi:hypothetical protein